MQNRQSCFQPKSGYVKKLSPNIHNGIDFKISDVVIERVDR